MSYEEYIIPVIISNILALILMLLSFHFTNFMRFLWGTIFMIAGIINLITVYNNPGIYISGFGPSAIELYKEIIYGPFSENPGLYITLIAFTQIIIGALMWLKYLWYNIGILGGVIFLIAIAPLGAASAFPSSIIMAIGLFRLLFKWRRKTIFGT